MRVDENASLTVIPAQAGIQTSIKITRVDD